MLNRGGHIVVTFLEREIWFSEVLEVAYIIFYDIKLTFVPELKHKSQKNQALARF